MIARRLHGPASVVWMILVGVHVLVYLKRSLISSHKDLEPSPAPPCPARRPVRISCRSRSLRASSPGSQRCRRSTAGFTCHMGTTIGTAAPRPSAARRREPMFSVDLLSSRSQPARPRLALVRPRQPRVDDEVAQLRAAELAQMRDAERHRGIAVPVRRGEVDAAVVGEEELLHVRALDAEDEHVVEPFAGLRSSASGPASGGSRSTCRAEYVGRPSSTPPSSHRAYPARACPGRPWSPSPKTATRRQAVSSRPSSPRR